MHNFTPRLNSSSVDKIKKPFHDRLEEDNNLRVTKRKEIKPKDYPFEPLLQAKSPKNLKLESFHRRMKDDLEKRRLKEKAIKKQLEKKSAGIVYGGRRGGGQQSSAE
eukprot:CAMPEP_0170194150 /NCGR_PEP_ID=MMETSP0040_2-20121228/58542_1 /TAXON_ID=641309 /ORGANISM="Lotharella oceanica, Strain CCMP622" /LENGTH=106 /DNA_ID=CAMNT_0010442987 /DNA_START=57 /DNA_END=377 /DNA_ORIENTATION=-